MRDHGWYHNRSIVTILSVLFLPTCLFLVPRCMVFVSLVLWCFVVLTALWLVGHDRGLPAVWHMTTHPRNSDCDREGYNRISPFPPSCLVASHRFGRRRRSYRNRPHPHHRQRQRYWRRHSRRRREMEIRSERRRRRRIVRTRKQQQQHVTMRRRRRRRMKRRR